MSLDTRKQIIQKLSSKNVKSIAIAMHNSPDGDCIGSAVALEKSLLKIGKKVDIILHSRINSCYAPIIGKERVGKLFIPPQNKVYDVLILVDCAEPSRTVEDIEKRAKFIITIDHHYGMKPYGNIYLYEHAASTGMIIHKIVKMLAPIDEQIANALYLTIRSDTCSFKNNNTDVKAHETAGELLFSGANLQLINEIYETRSLSMVRLMGYTLADVMYDRQYKIVHLIVRIDQIKKAQSTFEEASQLIDYIRGIEGAEIAFLFLEGNDNVRIKARSKNTNVSEIMAEFNGGGHPTASGAMLYSDDVYSVADAVVTRTKRYINEVREERVRSDGSAMADTK